MTDSRHLLLALVGALALLLIGAAVLVWPVHRETAAVRQEIGELRQKLSRHSNQADAVERLAASLAQVRLEVREDLKPVPQSPDIAALIRRLSLPVDAHTVRDQTFTAGTAGPAAIGEEYIEQAMPLTVDMEAVFDSVFAMIRAVEQMDRLVRVASVHMAADRAKLGTESPMLTATIGLEAIYEPALPEEGD